MKPDPAILAQGWEHRFLADPARAQEAADLYRSLGLEVLERPVKPSDFGPQCAACAAVACRSYVMIYTRRTR
ncbi:MAG: hypothetical protein HYY17_03160 [Planctomycetes bacterium]|nr:hypothetical protein [Planctomycetota bacterium]